MSVVFVADGTGDGFPSRPAALVDPVRGKHIIKIGDYAQCVSHLQLYSRP